MDKLDELSAAAKALSYKLGPFKFKLKRQENYSGEHREWGEELTLPVGAALTEQIILEALRTGQLVAVQGAPKRGPFRVNCPHCGWLGILEEHSPDCPRYPNELRAKGTGDE